MWNEKVVAYVVARRGAALTEQDVIEFCKARMASYKKPKEVLFVQELPRSAAGKVLKRELREKGPGPR